MAEPSVEFVTNNSVKIMSGSNGATVVEEETLKEVLLRPGDGSGDSGCEKDMAGVEGVEVLEHLGQERVKLKDQEEEKLQQQHTMCHEDKNFDVSMQNTNNAARDDDSEICFSAPNNSAELSPPPECRICSFEAEPGRPLFYPCACSGTIRWVHQDCLEQWLKMKNLSTERCEVCGVVFHFTPIYKKGTPACLAPCEFIRGVLTRSVRPISFALQISYAFIIWGGLLPLSTLALSRMYFCSSIQCTVTVIHSMMHSSLHELLCHIGVGTGVCLIIMVSMCSLPSAIISWLIAFIHSLLTSLMKPFFYSILLLAHICKTMWTRRWLRNVIVCDTTRERRRRGKTHHYCSSWDVLLRENETYNHDVYHSAAGILFVGTKECPFPEDGEEEEVASPPTPLSDVVVDRINAMKSPVGITIPGIGFLNLNTVLGITGAIASPILMPLLPLVYTILFLIGFLASFQFVPFTVGCEFLKVWNQNLTASNTILDSDSGEAFLLTQDECVLQHSAWKLVADRFLRILPYYNIDQGSSVSSYLSQVFSCDWLGRAMIKTTAVVTEREKLNMLELGDKLCMTGLGYGVIFGTLFLLFFTVSTFLFICERKQRVPRETSGREEEPQRSIGAVLYYGLHLSVQWTLLFLKVSFFFLIDVVVLPLWAGIMMDFCTLETLRSTVKDRRILLDNSPVIFMFCHWFVGVIYNLTVNATLAEVRKVISMEWLRDWLPQPESLDNPETALAMMANMPFVQRLRRTILEFGQVVPLVFLTLYLPLQASRALPGVSTLLELKLSEAYVEIQLPMELLFLHVIFPLAFDKINVKKSVQTIISWFLISTCEALELEEVFIDADTLHVWREEHKQDDQRPQGQQQHREQQPHQPLHHHAQDGEVVVNEDEERQPLLVEESVAENKQEQSSLLHNRRSLSPNHLGFRLLLLGLASCIFLMVACFIGINLPLCMGRGLCFLAGIPIVSDWHAVIVGFFGSWGLFSGVRYLYISFAIELDTASYVKAIRIWLVLGMKWLVLSVLWVIIAPLLIGCVFEAVVVTPLFYHIAETPRIVLAQDWALGLVALKLWMQYTILNGMGRGDRQIEREGRRGGEVAGRQIVAHQQRGGHPHHDPPSLAWADRLEKVYRCGVRGTLHAPRFAFNNNPPLYHTVVIWR